MRKFALAIPTCWYLKTRKFAIPPTRNIKFASTPNAKPQLEPMEYLGYVGSPMQNFRCRPRNIPEPDPVLINRKRLCGEY